MDDRTLVTNQQQLYDQAADVIKKLNLFQILAKYGQVNLVGSFALELMTWKDIDFEVVTPNPSIEAYWEIVKHLLNQPGVINLTLQDTTQSQSSNQARGLYIGLKYNPEKFSDIWDLINQGGKDAWKLDIWFTNNIDSKAVFSTKIINQQLTPESKLAILRIKQAVSALPSYRKTITSMDIYTAVINDKVVDLEGFKAYLAKNNKTL